MKDDWGAIGVTEDPSALRRWMVPGSEVSRLDTTEYKVASGAIDATEGTSHQEQKIQAK